MAKTLLESSALSAFCGSVATMLSAGIQTEEAVLMLAGNRERSRFQEVCNIMYENLVAGETFSQAMKATEGFPAYAVEMAATGEQSGHLEQVLRNLELYYDEEDKMIPELEKGETLVPLSIDCEQNFTKPPSRYTEASLVKELEDKNIGRPSTYAPIISTLSERKYVKKEKKSQLIKGQEI